MTPPPPNRILRELVDIHYFGERDGLGVRQQMEELCSQRLTRAIDGLLAGCGIPDDQVVTIDRLEMDVGGITSRDLEQELIPKIMSVLKAELEAKIGAAGQIKPSRMRPVRRSVFEEIIFFLERGYLPWSTDGGARWTAAAAEVLSNLDPDAQQRLVATLQSADARQRFVRHLPQSVRRRILTQLRSDAEWRRVLADVETLRQQLPAGAQSARLTERLLRILLDAALQPERSDIAAICAVLACELRQHGQATAASRLPLQSRHLLQALIILETPRTKTAGIAAIASRTVESSDRLTPALAPVAHQLDLARPEAVAAAALARDPDAIYVRNAGLVILAPYLPALFRKLELADDERLLDIPAALVLLHYLAFGADECAEWDLVLNKIICGIPLAQAVESPPPLTTAQKEEADRLLAAVIANWPALKNTSPDGLRSTFLQREGALRQQEGNWHLRLTRTGFDVLTDRLPWTISMIQLPWMPWLLRTDWAN